MVGRGGGGAVSAAPSTSAATHPLRATVSRALGVLSHRDRHPPDWVL